MPITFIRRGLDEAWQSTARKHPWARDAVHQGNLKDLRYELDGIVAALDRDQFAADLSDDDRKDLRARAKKILALLR